MMIKEDAKKIITIKAKGSFVFKSEIRAALSIPHVEAWRAEICLLESTLADFSTQYNQYRQRKRIPADLARLIVETILTRCGDPFELKFTFQE